MNLRKRFEELDPKRKKSVIWLLIGIVFLLLTITGYNSSKTDRGEGLLTRKKSREIQIEPDLIQKTMLGEQRRQIEALTETVANIQRELHLGNKVQVLKSEEDLPVIPSAGEIIEQSAVLAPPPVATQQPQPLVPTPVPLKQSQVIGEISVISNPQPLAAPPASAAKKNKIFSIVYVAKMVNMIASNFYLYC